MKLIVATVAILVSGISFSNNSNKEGYNYKYDSEYSEFEQENPCTELTKVGTIWTCKVNGTEHLPEVKVQTGGLIDRVDYKLSVSVDSSKIDEYIGDEFIQLPKVSTRWIGKGNSDNININLDLAPRIDLKVNPSTGLVVCKDASVNVTKLDIEILPDFLNRILKNRINSDQKIKSDLCNAATKALEKIQS